MKTVFLTPRVPPAIDGIGDYSWHLVRALRAMSEDAILVTSRGQEARESWVQPRVDRWDGPGLYEVLREIKPDRLWIQYAPPLYGRYGVCPDFIRGFRDLGRRLNCATGITFHEITVGWRFHPKTVALKWILDCQAASLLKSADAVVCTCERYKSLLGKWRPAAPVNVIPVGSNIPFVKTSSEEIRNLRLKYRIREGKILSIFGRLSEFRNFFLALDVLARARQGGLSASLMLLGCVRSSNPALFEKFMARARELRIDSCLVETGDLDAGDLSRHLQLTDVFLFPQVDGISTRSTTVMSALEHGLPVVAYEPAPGNYEGYKLPCGVLIPGKDERAFIRAALDNLEVAAGPDSNRNYFADHFSWEKIAESYLSLRWQGKNL